MEKKNGKKRTDIDSLKKLFLYFLHSNLVGTSTFRLGDDILHIVDLPLGATEGTELYLIEEFVVSFHGSYVNQSFDFPVMKP